jgi:hypothetical protein
VTLDGLNFTLATRGRSDAGGSTRKAGTQPATPGIAIASSDQPGLIGEHRRSMDE